MRGYHICYHTDEDGLASAAIIYEYLKLKNKNDKKAKYFFYKIDYTMDLEEVIPESIPVEDEIYFVDYSFSNRDNLEYALELSNKCKKVIWIDHHITSEDIVNGNEFKDIGIDKYHNFYPFIYTKYCAAYLCYAYAYNDINKTKNKWYDIDYVPWYIEYVDSWDTWKHDMPNTTEFNIGITSEENRTPKNAIGAIFKFNSSLISKFFSKNPDDIELLEGYMKRYTMNIISKGKNIKSYIDNENKSLCDNYAFEFILADKTANIFDRSMYNCLALNKRGNSTMFGDKINDYDIVVAFQFNGTCYRYSLFTADPDVDCELLAKKLGSIDGLGGGGHTKAAGFQTYNQILKADHVLCIENKLFRKNKYRLYSTQYEFHTL